MVYLSVCASQRQSLTEVAVLDLSRGSRACVSFDGCVRRLAVHGARLAAALPGRVVIHEAAEPAKLAAGGLAYRPIATLPRPLDCNLLMLTAQRLVLCQVLSE
jgi:hypothetical protein